MILSYIVITAVSAVIYALSLLLSCFVASNKLCRDGAHHLANTLSRNPPLEELVLSHNRIADEGLVHISSVLATSNINLHRYPRVCVCVCIYTASY